MNDDVCCADVVSTQGFLFPFSAGFRFVSSRENFVFGFEIVVPPTNIAKRIWLFSKRLLLLRTPHTHVAMTSLRIFFERFDPQTWDFAGSEGFSR